eukprot:scaffold2706_cov109-Isochrysis_galbana.AAC.18
MRAAPLQLLERSQRMTVPRTAPAAELAPTARRAGGRVAPAGGFALGGCGAAAVLHCGQHHQRERLHADDADAGHLVVGHREKELRDERPQGGRALHVGERGVDEARQREKPGWHGRAWCGRLFL